MTQHSGTEIRDLGTLVDTVSRRVMVSEEVASQFIDDRAECRRVAESGSPAKHLQPWEEIALIRRALAGIMFDSDGQPAKHYEVLVEHYHELAKLQDELMAADPQQ